MSFGFSPSDIVALINIAAKTYQGWKNACGDYADITGSLDSLLIILRRVDREARQPGSVLVRTRTDAEDLRGVLVNSRSTVRELHAVVERYKSLGLGRSREKNWDRICFGVKNLGDLHARLNQHTTAITAYLEAVGLGSLTRIEHGLDAIPQIKRTVDTLAAEIRAGRREGTVLTAYDDDEQDVWKQFRRELIGEGMRSSVIHKYKPQIRRYLRGLAERGLLQEAALEECEVPEGPRHKTPCPNAVPQDNTCSDHGDDSSESPVESDEGDSQDAQWIQQLEGSVHSSRLHQAPYPDARFLAEYKNYVLEDIIPNAPDFVRMSPPYKMILRVKAGYKLRSIHKGELENAAHSLSSQNMLFTATKKMILFRQLFDLETRCVIRWSCPYRQDKFGTDCIYYEAARRSFPSVESLKSHLRNCHQKTSKPVWTDGKTKLRFTCPYSEVGSSVINRGVANVSASNVFEDCDYNFTGRECGGYEFTTVPMLKRHMRASHTNKYAGTHFGDLSKLRWSCPYPFLSSGNICQFHKPGSNWKINGFHSVTKVKGHLRDMHLRHPQYPKAKRDRLHTLLHARSVEVQLPVISMNSSLSWYCPYSTCSTGQKCVFAHPPEGMIVFDSVAKLKVHLVCDHQRGSSWAWPTGVSHRRNLGFPTCSILRSCQMEEQGGCHTHIRWGHGDESVCVQTRTAEYEMLVSLAA